MGNINTRLERIIYQVMKGLDPSDEDRIRMIRGIYDAAIDSDTEIDVNAIFPTQGCGVTLYWEEDNRRLVFERLDKLLYDNLSDEIVPEPFDQVVEPVLSVDGEYLVVNGGTLLTIN